MLISIWQCLCNIIGVSKVSWFRDFIGFVVSMVS